MASPLLTDLYGLNMAASYLGRGMDREATFSLFVRDLPTSRGFLVAAGLDDCLDHLEQFCFSADDLDYLANIGFDAADLDAFARMRFTGEVRAVPEGRIVFANEPLLEVTAPIAEAQVVESFLLNQVTMQTTLATKAARCVMAAGNIDLVEFGFRRAQGVDAGLAVARLAVMVGFAGTSNVEAARRFGLRPMGTMAHSYIEAFPSELEAFCAFAEDRTGQSTFLVDTYDTLGGVRHAIEAVKSLGLDRRAAIRIDSGNLAVMARRPGAPLTMPDCTRSGSSCRAPWTSSPSRTWSHPVPRSTQPGSAPGWPPPQTPPTWTASTSWSPTTAGPS